MGYVVIQATFHSSKAPSNVPLSMRLSTASDSVHSFHNLRAPPVDDSVKKDTGISSNVVMEKCTSKNECASKSASSTDQRTLKLRIKVKSDILANKNVAIDSGLVLDNSPSSSTGNSPEESGGMSPVSQETPEGSPTGIVQVEDLFYLCAYGFIDIRKTKYMCSFLIFILFDATGYDFFPYPWWCANITSK